MKNRKVTKQQILDFADQRLRDKINPCVSEIKRLWSETEKQLEQLE